MTPKEDKEWVARWLNTPRSQEEKILMHFRVSTAKWFLLALWVYFRPRKLRRFRECIEEGRTVSAAFDEATTA